MISSQFLANASIQRHVQLRLLFPSLTQRQSPNVRLYRFLNRKLILERQQRNHTLSHVAVGAIFGFLCLHFILIEVMVLDVYMKESPDNPIIHGEEPKLEYNDCPRYW